MAYIFGSNKGLLHLLSSIKMFMNFHFKIIYFYRRLSIASDGDDIIIPFDSKPIVSKFGPISRVKPKPQKSTDPLQATADEVCIKRLILTTQKLSNIMKWNPVFIKEFAK